jgi:hypothetical protein
MTLIEFFETIAKQNFSGIDSLTFVLAVVILGFRSLLSPWHPNQPRWLSHPIRQH